MKKRRRWNTEEEEEEQGGGQREGGGRREGGRGVAKETHYRGKREGDQQIVIGWGTSAGGG